MVIQIKESPLFLLYKISTQQIVINKLWEEFHENIQNFKLLTLSDENKNPELDRIITSIYRENTILLDNVDKLCNYVHKLQ